MRSPRRALAPLALALVSAALATGALAPRARAQALFLGSEFQVNTFTAGAQYWISVAASAAGDFVVVWESSDGQDGSQGGIFARRFSSVGTGLATEFQVNIETAFRQGYPAVAMESNGDFAIVWESAESDGSARGIVGRRFSSAGAALASEFQVNTYVYGNQSAPAVGADGDGDFLVAWSSFEQDGYGTGVFAQRFSSAGAPVGGEFQVNAYTVGTQRFPAMAAIADRSFVVVWQSARDGAGYGIFARLFASSGAPLGDEFQVNTSTLGGQRAASVAASAGGDFVVAWSSGQFGFDYNALAQRFSSAGIALAGEFQVHTYTAFYQRYPAVAPSPGGGFVVVWEDLGQDAYPPGIFARRFSSSGAGMASEFQVHTYTTSGQRSPAVAASANGRFVVAWQSKHQDDSSYGVFAQRFGRADPPRRRRRRLGPGAHRRPAAAALRVRLPRRDARHRRRSPPAARAATRPRSRPISRRTSTDAPAAATLRCGSSPPRLVPGCSARRHRRVSATW